MRMVNCFNDGNKLNIEYALIGCLIIDPNLFECVDGQIEEDYFEDLECQVMFSFMEKRYKEGKDWDSVVIMDSYELLSYEKMCHITEIPTSTVYFQDYLDEFRFKYLSREIKNSEIYDIDDLDEITRLIQKCQESNLVTPDRETSEIFKDSLDMALAAGEEKIEMPLPFNQINAWTHGLEKGNLTFIGGRPGHNKTNFLINIVVNLLKIGKKIMMCDYEMKEERLIHRIVSVHTGLPLSYMTHGRNEKWQKLSYLEKNEMMERVMETKKRFENNLIIQKHLKLSEVKNEIRRHQPDFVSIDHLQIFAQIMPKDKTETTAQHVSNLCRELKTMADKFNIPIVVPSQVTRGSDGEMPTLAALKESGGIEENADLVMNIFTPYKASQKEEDEGKFEVLIAKNRHGETGMVDLYVDSISGRITDLVDKEFIDSEL